MSQRSKLPSWPIIPALLLLTACQATASSNSCGTLFHYSPEFEQQASAEMAMLQQSNLAPDVVQLVNDYGVTRDTIRACR